MSEFSESFHLSSTQTEDGAALLGRARVAGWVFPAAQGWVTVVADAEFGQAPVDALAAATGELLVHYVNAEDHGWSFAAWSDGELVSRYEAEWTFDDPEVDASGLDVDRFADLLALTGHEIDIAALTATLRTPDDDDLVTPGANPGHRFAALLGLPHHEWLSGSTLRADAGGPEAIRID